MSCAQQTMDTIVEILVGLQKAQTTQEKTMFVAKNATKILEVNLWICKYGHVVQKNKVRHQKVWERIKLFREAIRGLAPPRPL